MSSAGVLPVVLLLSFFVSSSLLLKKRTRDRFRSDYAPHFAKKIPFRFFWDHIDLDLLSTNSICTISLRKNISSKYFLSNGMVSTHPKSFQNTSFRVIRKKSSLQIINLFKIKQSYVLHERIFHGLCSHKIYIFEKRLHENLKSI